MNKFAISLLLALSASITCYGSTAAEPMSSATKGRDYYEERGEIVWEVPTQKQVIALTFDDGPDPKNTGLILDLLKQYEAKATFLWSEAVSRSIPNSSPGRSAKGMKSATIPLPTPHSIISLQRS